MRCSKCFSNMIQYSSIDGLTGYYCPKCNNHVHKNDKEVVYCLVADGKVLGVWRDEKKAIDSAKGLIEIQETSADLS